jgi:uncharacterized lipoprotein YmbA
MRLLSLSLVLLLAGCAGIPIPEVNTLPMEASEQALHKDARLEEFVERSKPVPAPGLHWRTSTTSVRTAHGNVLEQLLFVSGSW